MTIFAEMSVTPAEPICNGAAELAFKLNEIATMCGTLCISHIQTCSSALTAHQVFHFEVLASAALFATTEIRIFTFEALEIVQSLHGV